MRFAEIMDHVRLLLYERPAHCPNLCQRIRSGPYVYALPKRRRCLCARRRGIEVRAPEATLHRIEIQADTPPPFRKPVKKMRAPTLLLKYHSSCTEALGLANGCILRDLNRIFCSI